MSSSRLRPGQRVVPPLARYAVGAGEDMAVNHDASTNACAKDDAEHDRSTRRGAVRCLGKREAVGVVADLHRALQQGFKILQYGFVVEHHRVGVLEATGCARERAGCADTERAELPYFRFSVMNQRGDNLQCRRVIFLRCGYATAQDFLAAVVEGDDFDFGAAEVYA